MDPSDRPAEASRFPLTRYFVATGVITAVVVAAALAALSAKEVHADLMAKSERNAVLLVRNLNRQIHSRFIWPTIARDGAVDLDRPEQLAALDRVVRSAVADFDIHDLYLYDLKGRILYSTHPEQRGYTLYGDKNYDLAVKGQVASDVVARGSRLDISRKPDVVNLLETYVPVYRLIPPARHGAKQPPADAPMRRAEQDGVIEVYQDATTMLRGTWEATYRVALISTIGIVTLMLALWLWIRKAERTIDDRTQALVSANARLAALSADLERQVEDRSRRLLRAETLATVGTLSAGVAHEVNNPIASIASCAEGLLRRAKAESLTAHPDFADFPEYLQIIRDEAFRVKDITRNLLDFSRSGTLSAGPVDLGQLLEGTARLVSHRLEKEEKRLVLDLPPTRVVIRGDGASLRQLVLNVTVNAIDASPAGGVIRWRLRASPGGAELVCEDPGPGFTPEELERALEPFYTRKEPGKGTGLGLSIAYGIAREHGGEVELRNLAAELDSGDPERDLSESALAESWRTERRTGAKVIVRLRAARAEEESAGDG